MIKAVLNRTIKNSKCIIGEIEVFDDDKSIFKSHTLENPVIGEERSKDKAIPDGVYTLSKRFSPEFSPKPPFNGRDAYWVYNDKVPKDRYILIHNGNTEVHTKGCILLGRNILKDKEGIPYFVDDSRNTVNKFLEALEGKDLKDATLTIVNKFE